MKMEPLPSFIVPIISTVDITHREHIIWYITTLFGMWMNTKPLWCVCACLRSGDAYDEWETTCRKPFSKPRWMWMPFEQYLDGVSAIRSFGIFWVGVVENTRMRIVVHFGVGVWAPLSDITKYVS